MPPTRGYLMDVKQARYSALFKQVWKSSTTCPKTQKFPPRPPGLQQLENGNIDEPSHDDSFYTSTSKEIIRKVTRISPPKRRGRFSYLPLHQHITECLSYLLYMPYRIPEDTIELLPHSQSRSSVF
ncbi:hypothetical protein PLEOSDRAFT_162987 [Pleurotus ostreatus PC15]|uniref:Uncharacterized protein n=1 Tax=Pleurotus ostreatus (strain PC15) TaxID=1137138 RepID=A0A067ND79_PLEO1|nr:hypothetical protein PLEOSDRAFT_162987 [Pleurotus ostreatus PC15]